MRQGTAQEKRDRGRKGRAGSTVITQFKVRGVRANCKLSTATPANSQATHLPNLPFCIWQFDNNAGAQAQWGKHKRLTMAMAMAMAIAIARCKWSYALRLWCASASCPLPSPGNAQLNLRATAAATLATLSKPMWQTDLVTIIYSYALRCAVYSEPWQLIRVIAHFETV